MPVLANIKHERFAQNLAKGMSVAEAYVDAGYKYNDGNCSRLKGEERIVERVKELLAIPAQKASLDRSWVLDRLMRNAMMCLGELPVGEVKHEDGTIEKVYDRDPSAANKSLELLGKTAELAMFVERKEVTHKQASDLTDEELAQIARTAVVERAKAIRSGMN